MWRPALTRMESLNRRKPITNQFYDILLSGWWLVRIPVARHSPVIRRRESGIIFVYEVNTFCIDDGNRSY